LPGTNPGGKFDTSLAQVFVKICPVFFQTPLTKDLTDLNMVHPGKDTGVKHDSSPVQVHVKICPVFF
jgi:hypothetical protein